MKKEPNTLMPQLVLEARYFSHPEHGVEIGESISLYAALAPCIRLCSTECTYQWPPFTL